MEALPQTFSTPGAGDARLLTPMRVVAVGLVVAAAGLAAWQLRQGSREGRVPLLADTVLPSSELALMEAAFDRAKLTDYAIDGGRILVPKGRQSSFMRALVDAEALPREFGGSLRRAMETSSPWQSRATQDERLRIATQEELSLVLCSMPGIRRAAVLYDEEPSTSLGGRPRRTASVNLETDVDAALDRFRARSIRVLVAASIAGLEPNDVAVTDLRTGLVYAGPLEPTTSADDDAEMARIGLEERLASRIRRSLSYVNGVIVDVRAELASVPPSGSAPSSVSPSTAAGRAAAPQKLADANAPADVRSPRGGVSAEDTMASVPVPRAGPRVTAVHVAIALPESVAADSDASVRQHVLELLPPTVDPQRRTVTVTRFPVAGMTASRGHGHVVADDPTTADGGISPPAVQTAERRLELPPMPREAWLVGGLVIAAVAVLLWRRGGRAATPVAGETVIDWTHYRAGSPTRQESAAAATTHAAATVLLALLCLGSPAHADEQPAALSRSTLADPVSLAEAPERLPLGDTAGDPQTSDVSAAPSPVRGFEIISAVTVVAAVAALGLLGWAGRSRGASLPRDVFEVLGEGVLGRGQRVAVVRFGPKTLLVGLTGSACSTLSELDDAAATEAIAAACQQRRVTLSPRGAVRPARATSMVPTSRQPVESVA